MLGMAICFSANIGGTGTLVGTGSNVVMSQYLNDFDGNPVSFGSWMGFAIPQMLLCLAAAWIWLYFYFVGFSNFSLTRKKTEEERSLQDRRNRAVSSVIDRKYSELGPLSFHEAVVLVVFLLAFSLWFFLSPGFMTGWGDKLESTNAVGEETDVDDATPAVLVALLLFALPARPTFINAFWRRRDDDDEDRPIEASPPVIGWKTAQHKVRTIS